MLLRCEPPREPRGERDFAPVSSWTESSIESMSDVSDIPVIALSDRSVARLPVCGVAVGPLVCGVAVGPMGLALLPP